MIVVAEIYNPKQGSNSPGLLVVRQPHTWQMRTCIADVATCGLTILLQPHLTTLLTWV
eukprot:COSAG02_NODE_482_length_21409_cov_126.131018_6_plen_58_part_00